MSLVFKTNELEQIIKIEDESGKELYYIKTRTRIYYYFLEYCAKQYLKGDKKALDFIKPLKGDIT
jgi:hypothetical protein